MLKAITRISLSLILSVALFACQKNGDSPSGSNNSVHMTAKFDGQTKNFSTVVHAAKIQLGDGYSLTITGVNGTSETFSISIWTDMSDIHSGDVFNYQATGMSTENSLNWASNVANSNETTIWSSTSIYVVPANDMKVTITEITATTVKGTFSGTIYQNIDNPGTHSVTEGEFVAKFGM